MLNRVGSSDKGIGEDGIDWDDPNDPTRVMNTCGPDMIKLWANADIRQLLRAQKLRLEEMPGLYVRNVSSFLCDPDYTEFYLTLMHLHTVSWIR